MDADFKGAKDQTQWLYLSAPSGKLRKVLFVGTGDKTEVANVRDATHTAVRALQRQKVDSAALLLPATGDAAQLEAALEAAASVAVLSSHKFDRYKSDKKTKSEAPAAAQGAEEKEEEEPVPLTSLALLHTAGAASVDRAQIVAQVRVFSSVRPW